MSLRIIIFAALLPLMFYLYCRIECPPVEPSHGQDKASVEAETQNQRLGMDADRSGNICRKGFVGCALLPFRKAAKIVEAVQMMVYHYMRGEGLF
eukprot:TRINITY_DN10037_c0_g1_i1.p1 TRINITY_DN10037_c0_g1~~TRINITY_DN10037_c0_g1_i1.p1  ORF type:complete len:108 (-),score=7.33 TRINITY_DN10037_c0_g1_i1:147-431(-)